jgi:hypothetical protein
MHICVQPILAMLTAVIAQVKHHWLASQVCHQLKAPAMASPTRVHCKLANAALACIPALAPEPRSNGGNAGDSPNPVDLAWKSTGANTTVMSLGCKKGGDAGLVVLRYNDVGSCTARENDRDVGVAQIWDIRSSMRGMVGVVVIQGCGCTQRRQQL